MRNDVDRFIRHAGQRSPDRAGLHAWSHCDIQFDFYMYGDFADQISDRVAVVHTHRERRDAGAGGVELRPNIAGQSDDVEQSRRAAFIRSAPSSTAAFRQEPVMAC